VRELVETVVKGLVDDPEAVEVVERAEGHALHFEIRVAENDRGNVIGRQGATAGALRTLVNGLARRDGVRVEIDIVD